MQHAAGDDARASLHRRYSKFGIGDLRLEDFDVLSSVAEELVGSELVCAQKTFSGSELVAWLLSGSAAACASCACATRGQAESLAQRLFDADLIYTRDERADSKFVDSPEVQYKAVTSVMQLSGTPKYSLSTTAEVLEDTTNIAADLLIQGGTTHEQQQWYLPVRGILSRRDRALYLFRAGDLSEPPLRILELRCVAKLGVPPPEDEDEAPLPRILLVVKHKEIVLCMPDWNVLQVWLDNLTNPRISIAPSQGGLRSQRQKLMARRSKIVARQQRKDAGDGADGSDASDAVADKLTQLQLEFHEHDTQFVRRSPRPPSASASPTPSQEVRRITLQEVIDTPQYCYVFTNFCKRNFCDENIRFLSSVRAYERLFLEDQLAAPAEDESEVPGYRMNHKQLAALARQSSFDEAFGLGGNGPQRLAPLLEEPFRIAEGEEHASSGEEDDDNAAHQHRARRSIAKTDDGTAEDAVQIHRSVAAQRVVEKFLLPSSPLQVNIDSATARETRERIEAEQYTKDLFRDAASVIYDMVERDVYQRFLDDPVYRTMLQDMTSVADAIGRAHRRTTSFDVVALEENYSDLCKIAQSFAEASGTIKSRRTHLWKYQPAFKGSALVAWLVVNGFAANRPLAVSLGQRMLDANIISHITKERDFEDYDNLFYTMVDESKRPGPAVSDVYGAGKEVLGTFLLLKGVRYNRVFVVFSPEHEKLFIFRTKASAGPMSSARLKGATVSMVSKLDEPGIFYMCVDSVRSKRNFTFRIEDVGLMHQWLSALQHEPSVTVEQISMQADAVF